MEAFVDYAAYDDLKNDTLEHLNLNDEQLMLLPVRVSAFALRTRKWDKPLHNVSC